MTPFLVLTTITVYFLVLFFISWLAGRNADNQGFFIGNRKSSWYVVAFAMIGSSISGVTFISVPGWVAVNNFSYLQMVLGFVTGTLIIAYVLIPLFYKMKVVSIYEYLENRFGITTYKTGAWFFFISFICLMFRRYTHRQIPSPMAQTIRLTIIPAAPYCQTCL